jgi:hypothetical protein
MQEATYTTQLQAGLGMIPETLSLLRLWEPGMSPSQLADAAIREGLFSRTTARRARNLAAEMFAPRFLGDGAKSAENLRILISRRFSHEALVQLFFLYTARAQKILADFVVEVYWPKYSAGAGSLSRDDAERFVFRSLDNGRMAKRWTDSTIRRVSAYLIGCCVDFGLLAEGTRTARPIQRFSLRREVALYLAYDLHFSGLGSLGVIQHPDWSLFGLEPQEVIDQLRTLSHDGHLLVQSSGELVQISWAYKTMTQCLDALTQRQI